MTKYAAIVLTGTLALGGCASTGAHGHASSNTAQAIAKAQAAVQRAGADAALWPVSVQDLSKAKQAAAAGKDKQALKLAHAVLKQTALSEAQARAGANARPVYPGA